MTGLVPEALVALALAVALGLRWLLRARAPRQRWPLPADWREQLWRDVPQAVVVPQALRPLYERQVETFLADKRFVGCNGLDIEDSMRVAVAGLACLLILRPGAAVFPTLRTVLLYPDAFLVMHDEPDELGLVSDAPVEQIGESWRDDRVVLSWADVQAALAGDEVNVVAHEFAHQLDDETPETEGAPALADYSQWSVVMTREFERLQRHRRPPVLDAYGAESPGEFFGVVTEAFFQRGAKLRQHHAELYQLLRDYYRLETAALNPWQVAPSTAHEPADE